MDATTFDTISRIFAGRRTRRQALAGTAGLAAAMAVVPSLAQDATPEVTPVDPNNPHPSADDAAHDPEFLFVQPFSSGTWAPNDGADGTYSLTLTGASANTVYFSDRPERIFGLSPTGTFLDNLGFTPDNPPNAALVAQREDGSDQEVLVIELTNPVYDDAAATLTYDAAVLADYDGTGLAHAARQQQDYQLPESFAEGSLFIDDCPNEHAYCIDNEDGTVYGRISIGQCWDGSNLTCHDCHDPDNDCRAAFPDQCATTMVIDGITYPANFCHAASDL